MKKTAYFALFLIFLLSVVYMLGPTPPIAKLNPAPISMSVQIDSLDGWIAKHERAFKTLKPENEARIEWYNDSIAVTNYAVVYIHGFSASREEGSPVHRNFAQRYGCNLYLPRLYGHGLNTAEPLIDLTPENYLQSAKEAIAIGKQIGKKVILMCTSTGGTLGIYLAAHDPEVEALICYSPNISLYDPTTQVLTKPWGLQLARLISGSDYHQFEASEEQKKYWQTRYRMEALVSLRSLVDHTMTQETFSQISQPIFVGAYYKNEAQQDKVVSVDAMRQMMPQLATPQHKKWYVEFPNVGAHVPTNPLRSKDVPSVIESTFSFAEEVLGLEPVAGR